MFNIYFCVLPSEFCRICSCVIYNNRVGSSYCPSYVVHSWADSICLSFSMELDSYFISHVCSSVETAIRVSRRWYNIVSTSEWNPWRSWDYEFDDCEYVPPCGDWDRGYEKEKCSTSIVNMTVIHINWSVRKRVSMLRTLLAATPSSTSLQPFILT